MNEAIEDEEGVVLARAVTKVTGHAFLHGVFTGWELPGYAVEMSAGAFVTVLDRAGEEFVVRDAGAQWALHRLVRQREDRRVVTRAVAHLLDKEGRAEA